MYGCDHLAGEALTDFLSSRKRRRIGTGFQIPKSLPLRQL
jgi:hypothetical protein